MAHAAAQLLEEELQQSVLVSEGERDPGLRAVNGNEHKAADAVSDRFDAGGILEEEEGDLEMGGVGEEYEQDDSDTDAGEAEQGSADHPPPTDEGEDDIEDDDNGNEDEDGDFEDDIDGEAGDGTLVEQTGMRARFESDNAEADGNTDGNDRDEDEEEDDDDEGVGAVKIKPGDTEDEDVSENSAMSESDSGSDRESDGAAAWEQAAESEDEEVESDGGAPNTCLFCKQDEENDPASEFEAFLTCSHCGDNAHQQCARDANALFDQQNTENWTCPDCAQHAREQTPTKAVIPNGVAEPPLSPSQRRSSAPKLARDLLPSQKGTIKPDSHSVFNQLVLDEDPMDGSRVLRKRKTSSAEADEVVMSLRKRRKNSLDEAEEIAANVTATARPVRLKLPGHAAATIWKRVNGCLVMKFKVDPDELREILSHRLKAKKKRRGRGIRLSRPTSSRSPVLDKALIATPFTSTGFSQPFYSFYDKDRDELKGKPYGGILTETEADTSKTYPSHEDRKRFDDAKRKADDEWRQRILAVQADAEVPVRKSRKSSAPASQIECVEFGGWEIDTWYAAPYPEEYSRNRVLYICEFCLKYMNSDYVAWRHKLKCPVKHPPGDEIYRHASVSVFEVDGRKNPVYCQNLCLLAKLFLGSKTLYYDVEPFLFYILCEYDDLGYHFVGYFSKEKRASSQNNVSCILTLPIHQRKGYGNLLIDFSYLLTRVEEKTGSPEKPLSDMGLVSYRNYWRLIMCRYLSEHVPEDKTQKLGISIKQISDDTGLTPDDVISSLEGLRCLVRDYQTGIYAFRVDLEFCKEYVAKWDSKKYVKLNPKALTWTPYVMGRTNVSNFELGPAISAIAPREEEEEIKPPMLITEALPNGVSTAAATIAVETPNGTTLAVAAETEPAILQSTEPDEIEAMITDATPLVDAPLTNGTPGANRSQEDQKPDELASSLPAPDQPKDWTSAYEGIPATRFQVFPPGIGGKRGGRIRTTAARPTPSRVASSGSIRRPRRSLGSRRSTASKPKSSVKRKTGGTGRGPGRWPKGTKKSDYGNADSGPGLPPAWIAARIAAATATSGKNKKEGSEGTQDTVQVQTEKTQEVAAPKPSETVTAFFAKVDGLSESSSGKQTRSSRSLTSKDDDDNEDNEDEGDEDEEEEDDIDDAEDEEADDDDPDIVMDDNEEEEEDEEDDEEEEKEDDEEEDEEDDEDDEDEDSDEA